ncbi:MULTISPECIES: oxidoreductase [unclassified Bradyrhizobium]|uniref:oxidoreductase n=1 Tax=unclassified Bradyrhizobium TaxID=2631580 RepID=UPI001CD1DE65|nr:MULTISPECIES: oxidoreductase [unclassified Bradyrhizobium]MCA1384465.1 SDR family oxidoreductase [Bradyrhizobium sp. BRP05]MCA1421194.1 SDR family oxidoreductase [Bradyrhizobium sp. BRP23]MCA1436702.1 SDR family oxidoreductase [Bradyrhizobium sp. BRP20]MCA1479233.1 SDR family oxidoreductase [Bradyrhizobium sp. NBAIM08]MCA1550947.1 SDR family oxidoreductase [Bradyrhizobium sp. BRP19]
MPGWSASDIPSQRGRCAVVTGTGGLGYQDALALARADGEVIIAGRNASKGADAVARIRSRQPNANVRFERLDLADIHSVRAFGSRLRGQRDSLDLLVNNAAVMMPPVRQVTADGFEMQFGTNHLGHFALTAELLPLLHKGVEPRVVTVSSLAARSGAIEFDNLQAERRYQPMPIYSQSKLANLMFAFELQRRSRRFGWGITSVAAHPGVSRTDLIPNGAGRMSLPGLARTALWFLFQPAAQGALPTLFAATSPDIVPGGYYGPDKFGEIRGSPSVARVPPQADDDAVASHLWDVSATLTGARLATESSRTQARTDLCT